MSISNLHLPTGSLLGFAAPVNKFLQFAPCISLHNASTLKNDVDTPTFEHEPYTPTVEVEVVNQEVDLKGGRRRAPPPRDARDARVDRKRNRRTMNDFAWKAM